MKKKLIISLVAILIILICAVSFADEWRGSDEEGWWYSLSNGGYAKNQWLTIGGQKYYFNSSGYMATGWETINGNWVFFDKSGKMATGWFSYNGDWYYADKNGAMKTGWLELNKKWYYLQSSGAMATGWYKVGTWYYFKESGEMATGWFEDDGKWYYADEDGAYQTGWLKSGNTWYYLKPDGSMATGFTDIDGETYYFNSDGAMMTGWIQVGEDFYYCYTDFESTGKDYGKTVGVLAKDNVIGDSFVDSEGKYVNNPLSADKTEITIGIGGTDKISLSKPSAQGYIKYTIGNSNIVSIQYDKDSSSPKLLQYILTAKKEGTTTITFSLYRPSPTGDIVYKTIDVKVNIRMIEINSFLGMTISEANEQIPDKLIYIGDGYYSNGSFGVTLDSNSKINWMALLSDDTKYALFGVKPGMNWIQSQATLGGFGSFGWKPINNSPNDSLFVSDKYPNRRVAFKQNSQKKVGNVSYGYTED